MEHIGSPAAAGADGYRRNGASLALALGRIVADASAPQLTDAALKALCGQAKGSAFFGVLV